MDRPCAKWETKRLRKIRFSFDSNYTMHYASYEAKITIILIANESKRGRAFSFCTGSRWVVNSLSSLYSVIFLSICFYFNFSLALALFLSPLFLSLLAFSLCIFNWIHWNYESSKWLHKSFEYRKLFSSF